MSTLISELNKLSFAAAPIFYKLVYMSVTAIIIGAVILLIGRLADKKISPAWKYAIWICFIAALLLPVRFQSDLSLIGLTNAEQIQDTSYREEYDEAKQIQHDFAVSDPISEKAQIIDNDVTNLYVKSLVFDVALPLIWLFGCAVVILFMIISSFRLKIKINRWKKDIPIEDYCTLLNKCKQKLACNKNIEIIVQDYIKSPALIGLISPKIILPPYISEMNEQSVEYILLHELSHYKRLDMLINYLLIILQAIYWFNPLIWLLFKYIKQDMEAANDFYLLKFLNTEQYKKYSLSLVEILGRYGGKAPLEPKLLCMADNKGNLERRIKMIKLNEVFKKRKLLIGIFSVLIIGIVSALFLTTGTDNAPVDIVRQRLNDAKNNYGVVSLSVNSVKKVTDAQHIQNILEDEDAKKMGLKEENIAFVDAYINVQYDGTKVPSNSGENEYIRFTLIRENKRQPWLVAESGQGRGGIPFIDFKNPNPTKGAELYIWKNRDLAGSDSTYFSLFDGTNNNITESEIYDLSIAVDSIDMVNRELTRYPNVTVLAIYQVSATDFTKEEMSDIADKIVINADNHIISIGVWEKPLSQSEMNPSSIDNLPKEYTVEMAVKNGDYVNVHGSITNAGVMENFLDKVSKNETAFVRKVDITIEGDAVITDISFEKGVFNVTVDTTRDKFGVPAVQKYTYKNMVKYDGGDGVVLILTDLPEITKEQYKNWRNGENDIGYLLLG